MIFVHIIYEHIETPWIGVLVLSARILTPLTILVVGAAASAVLLAGRPEVPTSAPGSLAPAVRVITPEAEGVQLVVRSQGTVAPRTESDLVAEVQGRVVRISSSLESGAFFRAGEVLAEIDRRDFELAATRARAALERAAAERDFASATLDRRLSLAGEGIASEALLDEARRAARVAEARRREAAVDLERAERDLERTVVVAPYDGRVRSKQVDVGQFVSVGTPLARVYAVDYAEVRLPLPDEELAYLELPVGRDGAAGAGIEVILRARFAGRAHTWTGEIVRTEAEIDPRTRMVHLIARIPTPHAGTGDVSRPPLAAGLFVEAEILGRRVDNAKRLPRAALDGSSAIWVVDDENRLRSRRVGVLRVDSDTAWIDSGVTAGERISLSKPAGRRDGLRVRPIAEERLVKHIGPLEPAS